jgi:CRISPR-associated endonuclease Cas3-HD
LVNTGMKPVYSFYLEECDGSIIREELWHHVNSMLQLIRLPWNVRMFLQRIGLEEEIFIQALRISVIFHDMGKAYYQTNYKKDQCKSHRGEYRKYLSFMGHEFISACILYHVLRDPYTIELNMSQWEDDYDFIKGAMLYAVLYHHHAMAYLERREEILHGRNAKIKQPNIDETKYLTNLTEKTLGGKTSRELEKLLTTKPPDKIVTKNCLENILTKIKLPWTQNPSKMPKTTPFTLQRLLLTYLLALDNTSATQTRKNRRQTPYLKSIQIFTQNYLTNNKP